VSAAPIAIKFYKTKLERTNVMTVVGRVQCLVTYAICAIRLKLHPGDAKGGA